MTTKTKNPVLSVTREKAGAITSRKYRYQYYWALCSVLDRHSKKQEYAVFVELHEDVVIADSLDGTKATFEFNQVKTTEGRYTAEKLIKLKSDKSVLGKLLASSIGKLYESRVVKMALITPNGFKLGLKTDPKIDIKSFPFSHIDSKDAKTITDALVKEIKLTTGVPAHLHFIETDILESDFREKTTYRVDELIGKMYPSSQRAVDEICRTLIDELGIKGEVTEDFLDWEELLHKKALVSTTVNQVISNFTTPKGGNRLDADFQLIAAEIGCTGYRQIVALRQGFDRYRNTRFLNRSILQLDMSKAIAKAIKQVNTDSSLDMNAVLTNVIAVLPGKVTKLFKSQEELRAAIIFEYIMESNSY